MFHLHIFVLYSFIGIFLLLFMLHSIDSKVFYDGTAVRGPSGQERHRWLSTALTCMSVVYNMEVKPNWIHSHSRFMIILGLSWCVAACRDVFLISFSCVQQSVFSYGISSTDTRWLFQLARIQVGLCTIGGDDTQCQDHNYVGFLRSSHSVWKPTWMLYPS